MSEMRPYVFAWIALMVLLGGTVTGSQLFDGRLALAVVLVGALGMIGVIFFTFMGLKFHDALMRIYATGGALWLGFLVVLTLADYVTR